LILKPSSPSLCPQEGLGIEHSSSSWSFWRQSLLSPNRSRAWYRQYASKYPERSLLLFLNLSSNILQRGIR